jgi:hypothetical protein
MLMSMNITSAKENDKKNCALKTKQLKSIAQAIKLRSLRSLLPDPAYLTGESGFI